MPYFSAVVSSRSKTGTPSRLSCTRSLAMTSPQSVGSSAATPLPAGDSKSNGQPPIIAFLEILLFNQFANRRSNRRDANAIPFGEGIQRQSVGTNLARANVRDEILLDKRGD